MALYKYVGPYDEVRVSVAGVDLGVVENGASLAVPDELANSVEWSEHWQSASDSGEEPDNSPETPAVVSMDGTIENEGVA